MPFYTLPTKTKILYITLITITVVWRTGIPRVTDHIGQRRVSTNDEWG